MNQSIILSELILPSGRAVHDAQFEVECTTVDFGYDTPMGRFDNTQMVVEGIIYLGDELSDEVNVYMKSKQFLGEISDMLMW